MNITSGPHRIENPSSQWQGGVARSITFIVTEECQLRCRYCYLVHKNARHRMRFETARKTVEFVLNDRSRFSESSVILDFLGGEPFLEIDLIDRICDYFKRRAYELEHPWFDSYRFSFSTNGLLYADERVQRFIEKNRTHTDIGITIDGTQRKHDLQRVYKDGHGSYDDVVKNIPLWLNQYPNAATKMTFSHDDIPYVKESVLHVWDLGVRNINSNVVFEDVWKDGDDAVFEEQLRGLADTIVERDLGRDHTCSFFSRSIGKPVVSNGNWCGAGRMLAVDSRGNYYPCNRFSGFSMQCRTPRVVGHCDSGIDDNKVRPFLALTLTSQSPRECVDCPVASGCAWCQGTNYDFADTDTIYQRATYICRMHKARVRANEYFWQQFDKAKAGRGNRG